MARPAASTIRASLLVGVARDQRRRPRRTSSASRARVGEPGRARCAATHSGVSAASCDEQPAAGVDDRAGVEGLLAVADRQRHEDRRQADGGDLGDGVGAGSGRARGRRRRRRGPCGRRTAARRTAASPAVPGHQRLALRARRRAAPAPRPRRRLRAAADTDWLSRRAPCEPPVTSSVGRSASSPKVRPRLVAQRGPVERGDHPADRQPDVRARARSGVSGKLVATWSVNRAPSLFAMPGSALPSCTTIGTLPPAGREVGRHRDVAAEADHHVGADPVDDLQGGLDRAAQPGRDPEQVGARAARQRHRRDQLERVARLGDDPALEPARGAERGDLDAGVETAQGVGGGEQRGGVPRRSAPGQQDLHRMRLVVLLEVTPAEERRRRRSRRAALAPGSERANETSRPSATSEGSSAEPP